MAWKKVTAEEPEFGVICFLWDGNSFWIGYREQGLMQIRWVETTVDGIYWSSIAKKWIDIEGELSKREPTRFLEITDPL